MATTGGGRALGLNIGLIKKGYAFDAIVIDTSVRDSNLMIWGELDNVEDILQKIIYNSDRKNILSVWVQGRLVKGG